MYDIQILNIYIKKVGELGFIKPVIRKIQSNSSFFIFFFKQNKAYEISLGLVSTEMCIRDRARCDVSFERALLYFMKNLN